MKFADNGSGMRSYAMGLIEIAKTYIVNTGSEFVILLKSSQDDRSLPVSIGPLEAQSIAMALNGIETPRPLTHDLFKSTLQALDCPVVRVEVSALIDDTFYARLFLSARGETMEVDSRPSDAIALALRFSAPIFVEEEVMERAGVVLSTDSGQKKGEAPDKLAAPDPHKNTRQPDSLQEQLDQAVSEERYEDAARLRDEIKKQSGAN